MSVGGAKNGGKHWTRAEVDARQAANEKARRRTRVMLKPPAWVKENEKTLAVWRETVKKLRGIELLDNLDTEILAVYCDAVVHYRESSKELAEWKQQVLTKGEREVSVGELDKAAQAWSRIMLSFADKLGILPGGRARLAKKKANKTLDEFEEQFG